MKCSKCSGEMEEGIQLDKSYGATLQAMWVKGKKVPSVLDTLLGRYEQHYYVMGYRCKECGFLEYYAKEKA